MFHIPLLVQICGQIGGSKEEVGNKYTSRKSEPDK